VPAGEFGEVVAANANRNAQADRTYKGGSIETVKSPQAAEAKTREEVDLVQVHKADFVKANEFSSNMRAMGAEIASADVERYLLQNMVVRVQDLNKSLKARYNVELDPAQFGEDQIVKINQLEAIEDISKGITDPGSQLLIANGSVARGDFNRAQIITDVIDDILILASDADTYLEDLSGVYREEGKDSSLISGMRNQLNQQAKFKLSITHFVSGG